MTTTSTPTTHTTTHQPVKAVVVVGDVVQVWFASATGSTSDTTTHTIECASHEHAVAVARLYRGVWGV